MAQVFYGGDPCNFPGIAAANLLTTTSQFRVVGIPVTTTAADITFQVLDTTTTHAYAVGINQTFLTSSAAPVCNVRMFGVSKAIAGGTITAGAPVIASGNGTIVMLNPGVTATAVSLTTHQFILGFALQNASTVGAACAVFINPQVVVKTYA